MIKSGKPEIAIVDFGLGNLFSVRQACEQTGMRATLTSAKRDILTADAVILPGVGAFGDAMAALRRLDLVEPLKEMANSEKPFIGICLGLQLLMTESCEFGRHRGLGVIAGTVVKFDPGSSRSNPLKVPHVGWNRIFIDKKRQPSADRDHAGDDAWRQTALEGLHDGEYMYFVHSFYAVPEDESVLLSRSHYGPIHFCSSLQYRNIFASQFHPERSGIKGLQVYKNIASFIHKQKQGE